MAKKQDPKSKKANKETRKNTDNQSPSADSLGSKVIWFFKHKSLGKVLLTVLVIIIVLFLNLLISGDRLETFSLLTGVEILLAVLFAWLIFLWKRKDDNEGKNQ